MAVCSIVPKEKFFGSGNENIIKRQLACIHDIVAIPTFSGMIIPFFIYDRPGFVPLLLYDVICAAVFISLWMIA